MIGASLMTFGASLISVTLGCVVAGAWIFGFGLYEYIKEQEQDQWM